MKALRLALLFTLLPCTITSAQSSNDDFTNATQIDIGANCVDGSTLSASPQLGDLSGVPTGQCTFPGFDKTVWFMFEPKGTAGASQQLTISTDNGINRYHTDTRFVIYQQTGSGIDDLSFVGCAEGGGEYNPTAAVYTGTFNNGDQYYIVADAHGQDASFCINVVSTATPANDCITNAIDLTHTYHMALGYHAVQESFTYYAQGSSNKPGYTAVPGDDQLGSCNGVEGNPVRDDIWFSIEPVRDDIWFAVEPVRDDIWFSVEPDNVRDDIWFKIDINNSDRPTWISTFATIPEVEYAMAIYGGKAPANCQASHSDLVLIDCSSGDNHGIYNTFGSKRDMAKGSNPYASKLDLTGLADGTYYIRVWQYLEDNETLRPGNINIVFESASGNAATDRCPGSSNVGCILGTKKADYFQNLTGTGLFGMKGNFFGPDALYTASRPNERASFTPVATNPVFTASHCGASAVASTMPSNTYLHNSAYYRFTVDDMPLSNGICQGEVQIKLHDIDYAGTNGGRLYLQILRDAVAATSVCELNSSEVVLATWTDGDCITIPVTNPGGGIYTIMATSEYGDVVTYDLDYEVVYENNLTGQACGALCGSNKTAEQELVSNIHPIPASGYVNFQLDNQDATATVTLYSATGQMVRAEMYPEGTIGMQTLDLRGLPSGSYLLKVVAADSEQSTPILIK